MKNIWIAGLLALFAAISVQPAQANMILEGIKSFIQVTTLENVRSVAALGLTLSAAYTSYCFRDKLKGAWEVFFPKFEVTTGNKNLESYVGCPEYIETLIKGLPKLIQSKSDALPRAICLTGVAGSGKTSLVEVMAGSLQCPLIKFDIRPGIAWIPKLGENYLKKALMFAKESAKKSLSKMAIIFIDEIHQVAVGDMLRALLLELGKEHDAISEQNSYVLIIAATDRVYKLDDALIRSERFRVCNIENPTKEMCKQLIKHYMPSNKSLSVSTLILEATMQLSAGFTPADIKSVMKYAAFNSDLRTSNKIENSDLKAALKAKLEEKQLQPHEGEPSRCLNDLQMYSTIEKVEEQIAVFSSKKQLTTEDHNSIRSLITSLRQTCVYSKESDRQRSITIDSLEALLKNVDSNINNNNQQEECADLIEDQWTEQEQSYDDKEYPADSPVFDEAFRKRYADNPVFDKVFKQNEKKQRLGNINQVRHPKGQAYSPYSYEKNEL